MTFTEWLAVKFGRNINPNNVRYEFSAQEIDILYEEYLEEDGIDE